MCKYFYANKIPIPSCFVYCFAVHRGLDVVVDNTLAPICMVGGLNPGPKPL